MRGRTGKPPDIVIKRDTLVRSIRSHYPTMTNEQIGMELYRLLEAEDSDAIRLMRRSISKRLRRGVGPAYLIQLRALYTMLGHFLKKVKYI